MTATRKARPKWGDEQWRDYGRRLQATRDRLGALIGTFPETPGLKASHINALMGTHRKFVHAMIGIENVVAHQFGELDPPAIRHIHGPKGTSTWNQCRGRVRRDAPALTRKQWADLGREFKAIAGETRSLWDEVMTTAGPTSVHGGRFVRFLRAFDAAAVRFENLAYAQHPDWFDCLLAFSGAVEPKGIGEGGVP